jgi:hypothetical protein
MLRILNSTSMSTSDLANTVTPSKTIAPFEPLLSYPVTITPDFTVRVRNPQLHICIRSHIMASVNSLTAPFFDDPYYSDIIIKFGGHQIRAHKAILAQQSGYFAAAFFGRFQVKSFKVTNRARLTLLGCIEPCHRSGRRRRFRTAYRHDRIPVPSRTCS